MAYKSTRVTTGRGGRPKANGPRHTNGTQATKVVTPDEDIQHIEAEQDDIREAIRDALVSNTKNLKVWMQAIGEEDPKGAITIFKDFAEFVLPKLQRTDSKVDPASPVQLVFETTESFAERQQAKKDKQSKPPTNDFP